MANEQESVSSYSSPDVSLFPQEYEDFVSIFYAYKNYKF